MRMKTLFSSIAAGTGAIGCPAFRTQSAGLRAARRSASMTVVRASVFHLVAVPVSPNHALQRTPGFGVQLPSAALIRPAQSRAVRPAMKPGTARAFASRRRAHSRAPGPESLSLGSLGVTPPLVTNHVLFRACPESAPSSEAHGFARVSHAISSSRSFTPSVSESVSTATQFWSFISRMRSEDTRFLPVVVWEVAPNNATPNHALQRTPGFGGQLPGAALIRPAQSRAVLPAMKPGTARAFASRRLLPRAAPGPESLSLGSLGAC